MQEASRGVEVEDPSLGRAPSRRRSGRRRRRWEEKELGKKRNEREPSKTSLPEPYSVQTPRAVLPLHPAVVPVSVKTGIGAIPRCTVL